MGNGTCLKCNDSNCVDCSTDALVCKKCSLMFTLQDGTCLRIFCFKFIESCPTNTTMVPASFFNTQCLAQKDSECLAYLSSHYGIKPYLKCD